MEHKLKNLEYSNTDASKEQVKTAICAAKLIMKRPLPLTHAYPEIALVGYKEETSGRYKLLTEIRIFQTKELFSSMTLLEDHVRLFALPYITEEDYESVEQSELPSYRVYEAFSEADLGNTEKTGE